MRERPAVGGRENEEKGGRERVHLEKVEEGRERVPTVIVKKESITCHME